MTVIQSENESHLPLFDEQDKTSQKLYLELHQKIDIWLC